MAIFLKCGKCGNKFAATEDLAGKKQACPRCGTVLRVPLPDSRRCAGELGEQ